MTNAAKQLQKDEATLYAMARIYCKDHHGASAGGCQNQVFADDGQARTDSAAHADGQLETHAHGLCPECAAIIDYSIQRTRACPFDHQGNCDDCTVRCYRPEMRAGIRQIMAYAGPRMLTKHPIMAFRHLAKKLKKRK